MRTVCPNECTAGLLHDVCTGQTARCDLCERFESDEDAAVFLAGDPKRVAEGIDPENGGPAFYVDSFAPREQDLDAYVRELLKREDATGITQLVANMDRELGGAGDFREASERVHRVRLSIYRVDLVKYRPCTRCGFPTNFIKCGGMCSDCVYDRYL